MASINCICYNFFENEPSPQVPQQLETESSPQGPQQVETGPSPQGPQQPVKRYPSRKRQAPVTFQYEEIVNKKPK